MKRQYHLLLAAFVLLLAASCDRGGHYAHLMAEAERMNQCDSLFASDSIGRALVRHYDHWWHSRRHRLCAYYMLGCAYRDMGNAPRAIESYQRAVELGKGRTDSTTLEQLMRVHSQMSEIYRRQRLPELMQKEADIAARIAWDIGDVHSALIFENVICRTLYNNGDYEECIEKALQLHDRYMRCGLEADAKIVYVHCVKSCLQLKDFPNVSKYLELYESCPYFQNAPEKVIGGIGALHTLKGEYYLGIQQGDSAEVYFRRALGYKHQGTNELLATKGLYKTYALLHQTDSALIYAQLYSDAKERDFDRGISEATAQAEKLYNYNIEQREAERKTAQTTRLLNILYLCIALIAIAIGVILFFIQRREKEKLKFRELQQDHQRATNELYDLEGQLAAEKNERESNQNTIDNLLNDIEHQRNHIAILERSLLKKDNRYKGMELEDSDIVKHFRQLRIPRVGIDGTVREEDWQRLRKVVEDFYPMFYDVMNGHQHLSEKEYRVCLLVKINFGSSDIDVLMNQRPSFASITKKRLHQKVFGYEGSAADFERKLHQF